MNGSEYRDRIAAYIQSNFAPRGLAVYTEISLGKTIIGKRRRIDVFVRHETTGAALGLECKHQHSSGTTDEKIPYALQDLEAMWIPGCLVYAGSGWSPGVLHTLEGSRNAVFCDPPEGLGRCRKTEELDHVVASVFSLWGDVLPEAQRFGPMQLELPVPPLARTKSIGHRRGPRSA